MKKLYAMGLQKRRSYKTKTGICYDARVHLQMPDEGKLRIRFIEARPVSFLVRLLFGGCYFAHKFLSLV